METFGKWTVLSRNGKRWRCRCECGTERDAVGYDVRAGKSRGCGCDRPKRLRDAAQAANTKHGMGDSVEMRIWVDMRRRCYQAHRPDFHNYGGRGIYVCDRWRNDFSAFFADMGFRPTGKTLDRLDNDGPYSPENCVWADAGQQGLNRRTNVRYDFFGEALTLVEAGQKFGFKAATLRSRISLYGWTPEQAVSKPTR